MILTTACSTWLANKERHQGIDQTPAFVASYRNVGSANQPRFDKVNDD